MSIDPPNGTAYLVADAEKLSNLYIKLAQVRGVFDDFMMKPDALFKLFMQPNTLWLERTDGNGVLYLTNIIPGLSAMAHIVFWDKKLAGREEFTMDCLRWAIQHVGLKKINVWMPDFAKVAIHFAKKLGFKYEGKVRRWSFSQGRIYDILMYGMTNEEAFSGQFNDPVQPAVERFERPVHQAVDGHVEEPEYSSSGEVEQPVT